MAICRICFQEGGEIPVPGRQGPKGVVHEDCLAAKILELVEDPKKEGILKIILDYEEAHSPDDWALDVSAGLADARWEADDIGVPTYAITPLKNAGVVSVIFNTNSSTYYSLVARDVVKRVLCGLEAPEQEERPPAELPDLSCIVGYDDVKAEMLDAIRMHKRIHFLLIGPPATAKSLFLWQLGKVGYLATGSRVTGPGLTEVLFTKQPRVLLLDEIDKMPGDALTTLLSLMESGDVAETKYRRQRKIKLDTIVIGAGNSDRNLPPELMSRFDCQLFFKPYGESEFIHVCREYLSKNEGMPVDIAEHIGKAAWLLTRDIRTARGISRMVKEPTREEVNRVAQFLYKYSKTRSQEDS